MKLLKSWCFSERAIISRLLIAGVVAVVVATIPTMSFAVAAAVEATWIGGGSGEWKVDANWDAGGATGWPSGAGSIARFTNSVTVTSNGGIAYCKVVVADNCTVAHNTSANCSSAPDSNGEVVFDVGRGATFTQGGTIPNLYGGSAATFVKTGEGTASFGGCVGYNSRNANYCYKTADVRGGTLKMTCNYGPRLTVLDNRIRIRSGAKFLDARTGTDQMINSMTVVEIDEGGTLDFSGAGGTGGTLRGIVGSGTAKLGGTDASVTLRGEDVAGGSRGTFTGTISGGSIKMMPTNGMQMVFRPLGSSYADVQTNNARIVDGGVGDGGFCKDGPGCLALNNYVACSGPIVMRAGKISASATAADVLGHGSVRIDRGLVSIVPNRSDFKIATNALAQVTVNGPVAIRLDSLNADLRIGPEGAASTPFAFGADGMLAFVLPPSATLSGNQIAVNGGLPSGLPVFAYYQYLTDGPTFNRKAGYNLIPVKADVGSPLAVSREDYTNAFPTAGSGAVVRKAAAEILDVPANAASIAELHVFGGGYVSGAGEAIRQRKIGGVRIPQGVTLSVGDGSRGVVLLNNYYYVVTEDDGYGWARVYGAGTLDFGSSRGIVVANDCYDSYSYDTNPNGKIPFPAQVNCRIAGSAGVYFASPLTADPTVTVSGRSALIGAYMRAVEVGGDNTYSGGTRIDSMVVQPLRETSLGVDAVTIVGDSNGGGELNFTAKYEGGEFSRNLTISGKGYPSTASAAIWGSRAAISAFGKKIRLTGAITLAGDATIASSGEDSHIVLEGSVSGEGTLHVTSGRVIVKKLAYDSYKAGMIVADEGAEIVEKPSLGMLFIVR